MRTRITAALMLLIWITSACQSKTTAKPSSLPSTPTAAGAQGTVPAASLAYPPPGKPAATPTSTNLNSVILLKDALQGKSIVAYYDPSMWQAGPSQNLNASWSGQVLTASTITGCTLRFSGGAISPDLSWQPDMVLTSLNPHVTLYETFTQPDTGAEMMRLYRVDSYDSAFAVRLDGIDGSVQDQCVKEIEQVLGTVVIQSIYP